MKSNVYHQFEISDQERSQIADLLDDEKTKRIATRDELKEFVDGYAARWRAGLAEEHSERFGADTSNGSHLAAVPDPDPDPEPEADTPLDVNDLI